MIKLALLGATGKMGGQVLELLASEARFQLAAALTRYDDPRRGEKVAVGSRTLVLSDQTEAQYDVVLDVSAPLGTMLWLDRCLVTGAAMVIGATGHSAEQRAKINASAGRIPLLMAANFSLGVNVLLKLAGDAARRLGPAYDIEIVEHHHRHKVDAPSGTARAILESVRPTPGGDSGDDVVYGRQGQVGPRPVGQIGVHAVRMGDVIGHHEVHFAGPGETLTLTHTAWSRDTFARGALEAAAWIQGKKPGLYSMQDVLAAPATA